jgi:hypothetical protein
MQFKIIISLLFLLVCKPETKQITKDYSLQNNEALAFCKKNNFSTDYYILIDLSIHSGRNRFFLYNFKTKKNEYEKLVTHGTCDVFSDNEKMWEKAKFSNKLDSHCSSKGKYKIGKRDWSQWGIKVKYWLYGLEDSNNNAVSRVTVLHSWEAVSDAEVYPKFSPLSWGCPAISNEFMEILDSKLQQSKLPVLLWIIE